MAKQKLIVNSEGSETRVGVLEDGVLRDYILERDRERGIVGNIYKARVSRVLPGMQAAFVDLGPTVDRKAYLYVADVLGGGDEKMLFDGFDQDDDDDEEDDNGGDSGNGNKAKKPKRRMKRKAASQRKIEELLKEGQDVIVQITKDAVGQKGARVTGYVSLPGRHCVLLPTVNRVGVSHRVSSEKERRRLRDVVNKARPKGAGFIVRTAADGADADEVKDDVEYLVKLWERVLTKNGDMKRPGLLYSDLDMVLRSIRDLLRENTSEWIIDDEEQFKRAQKFAETFLPSYLDRIKLYDGRKPIFDAYGLEADLRTAMGKHVPLKSGGSLVIEQGEALTAIDVNTGSFVGSSDLEDTITKNNLEACKEVAHQLRLRNIGGIIVIDFVDMDKADNRQLVWDEFQKALATDRSRANVTRISELGLVEMTRKRTRESLNQLLTETCPTCSGRGRVKSTTTVAYEILREVRKVGASLEAARLDIEAAPKVAELLERYERDYLDGLEKRFHKQVIVTANPSLGPTEYKVAGKAKSAATAEEPVKKRGGRRKTGRGKSSGSKSSGSKSSPGKSKAKSSSRGKSKKSSSESAQA
jgi:ribonuclease G